MMSRGRAPPTAAKPRLSSGRQYPDGFVMYDGQLQPAAARPSMIGSRPLPSIPPHGSTDRRRPPGPAAHLQTTVQLHPGATCTCRTHPRAPPHLAAKVRSIGTGPTRDDDWGGGAGAPLYGNTELPYASPDDQHHYFVLDPDVVQDDPSQPPPSPDPAVPVDLSGSGTAVYTAGTVDSDSGLRFPTPPPPLLEATLPATGTKATAAGRRQSPDGKERDEGRDAAGGDTDELAGKNPHRGRSIHEIPLRPTRDGQTPAGGGVVVGGPLCDDSGVDMGTSSWP